MVPCQEVAAIAKGAGQIKVEVSKLADNELPRLWGEVMEELRDRGIVHSGNSPIADIAERVAVEHLPRSKQAPPNTRGYDLRSGRDRIQVKAVRQGRRRRSNLSPIRSDEYDAVVVVVFDAVLRVKEILELKKAAVKDCGRYSSHVNGHILSLSKVRSHPKVSRIDVKRKWRT